MERRKFTREFKLEAVKLIKERGVPYVQAARDLGVHESVLRCAAQLGEGLRLGSPQLALRKRRRIFLLRRRRQRRHKLPKIRLRLIYIHSEATPVPTQGGFLP
jgi:transposase-like protein